jgi:predicted nucleotidyltransferase component of viral defense system
MIEEWHPEVLTAQTQKTLSVLADRLELRHFYLAGGTALALQWGHRTSVDLDFFSYDKVDEDSLLGNLQAIPETSVVSKASETLHLHINSTKVSFLGYHYKVLYEFQTYKGIAVADPRDIAAMKLSAVASRGTKRDFVDLYVLSQRFGLTEIFRLFERKFAQVAFNDLHLMKSLTYFRDAEVEPMPYLLRKISWDEVKHFFVANTPRPR